MPLRDALRLTEAGEGPGGHRFTAEVPLGWDVRDIPHGGYLLALAAAAVGATVAQPDPLSVSATYLAPPVFGPAELTVAPLRLGKRQSTAIVALDQEGLTRVHATATFGHLPDGDPEHPGDPVRPPDLPPPERCLAPDAFMPEEGGPIRLHHQLDLHLAPDTGWVAGTPRGTAEISGWMRLADGSDPDPYAVLAFSDGMPPSLFEARGREIGHVPTMQLTTHLLAEPAPGWVQGRFQSRVVNGSYVDEDGDLWDQQGRLVATSRQLALLVPPRA